MLFCLFSSCFIVLNRATVILHIPRQQHTDCLPKHSENKLVGQLTFWWKNAVEYPLRMRTILGGQKFTHVLP